MKSPVGVCGAGLVLGAIALAGAQAQDSAAARTGPTAPELQDAKAVYADWCAPCHAAQPGLVGTVSLQAKYDGRIPAALEDRTDMAAPAIAYFVRNGVAWMPPFRPTEISETELQQLTAYLTAPLEDRGPHALLLAEEMAQREHSE